jgi:hypothetical protein
MAQQVENPDEIRPIKDICQLCGATLTMGHLKLQRQRGVLGKFGETEWVHIDNETSIPGSCPKSPDGRHVISGM